MTKFEDVNEIPQNLLKTYLTCILGPFLSEEEIKIAI